jgi:FtsH-binding integral membrane protein
MDDKWLYVHGLNVAEGVAAIAIWTIGGICIHFADRLITARFRIPALPKVYAAIVVFFAGMFFVPGQDNLVVRLASYVVGASLLSLVLRSIFKGFQELGIAAAFHSTQQGVGFEQSLQLAKTSLDFLGIGANKLTEKAEAFDAAMKRCATGAKTLVTP